MDVPSRCTPIADAGYGSQDCSALEKLVLSDPVIIDDSGDGTFSPGESGRFNVTLNEVRGEGFYWYPAVSFSATPPSITIGSPDIRYGILPCTSDPMSTTFTIPPGLAAGTVVELVATVSMLGSSCPGADSAGVSFVLQ